MHLSVSAAIQCPHLTLCNVFQRRMRPLQFPGFTRLRDRPPSPAPFWRSHIVAAVLCNDDGCIVTELCMPKSMFCSYSLDFTATLHYQVLRSVYIMQEMFLFLQCFNQSEVTVSAGLCRAAGGDAPNSGSNTDCHRTAPPNRRG